MEGQKSLTFSQALDEADRLMTLYAQRNGEAKLTIYYYKAGDCIKKKLTTSREDTKTYYEKIIEED